MPGLAGYRTYIVGGLIGLITALEAVNVVPPEAAAKVREFLVGLGFVTLRAGMK